MRQLNYSTCLLLALMACPNTGNADPMPENLIGRWSSEIFCKPDGTMVTITVDTLSIAEHAGPPLRMTVSATAVAKDMTRLTIQSDPADKHLKAGDSLVVKQFGNQLQLMETVTSGVQHDESTSLSLIKCVS